MHHYIALIHKDGNSDFGVSFPDLPGCVTAGTTLSEARTFAGEASALHLQGLAEDKESAPKPSPLKTTMNNRANKNWLAVVVPVRGAVIASEAKQSRGKQ